MRMQNLLGKLNGFYTSFQLSGVSAENRYLGIDPDCSSGENSTCSRSAGNDKINPLDAERSPIDENDDLSEKSEETTDFSEVEDSRLLTSITSRSNRIGGVNERNKLLDGPELFGDQPRSVPRRKRRRKARTYTVNMTNCKYDSVRRVIRRFGFREVGEDEDWNLYWTDMSVSIDRVVSMKTWQKINHFPGMSEICRKDFLARNLNRMVKAFPKDYAIFPKTWCLPAEWNELQNYVRKRKNHTFILKPDAGCQGRGIYIARSLKDIRPMESMICQVYMKKPLLIDGYKFDMRIYVLMTSCDPLRLFMFNDGLARFTTVPYCEPTQRNQHNMYMHLTNYAVQKHSDGYIRDNEQEGTKRRITTVNQWFTEQGHDLKKIWDDVDDAIIKTVLSGYGVLRHNYRTCFPNHIHTSACFEVLGFDIMFNHKLKPYILEVNHSPSFNTDSQLDREIKDAMLWDTLQLAHFTMLSKKKCMEEERRRIRTRLLQKHARKDIKDLNEKQLAQAAEASKRYELNHLGNFRMIYPCTNMEKYNQFIEPNASFYQETMTYRVRSEHARQMRAEIQQKQEKLQILRGGNKSVAPESPTPKKMLKKVNYNLPNRISLVQRASKKNDSARIKPSSGDLETWRPRQANVSVLRQDGDNVPTYLPQPIMENEELARLESLHQREKIMETIGLIDTVRRILADSPGVSSVGSSDPRAKQETKVPVLSRVKSQLSSANKKISYFSRDLAALGAIQRAPVRDNGDVSRAISAKSNPIKSLNFVPSHRPIYYQNEYESLSVIGQPPLSTNRRTSMLQFRPHMPAITQNRPSWRNAQHPRLTTNYVKSTPINPIDRLISSETKSHDRQPELNGLSIKLLTDGYCQTAPSELLPAAKLGCAINTGFKSVSDRLSKQQIYGDNNNNVFPIPSLYARAAFLNLRTNTRLFDNHHPASHTQSIYDRIFDSKVGSTPRYSHSPLVNWSNALDFQAAPTLM